VVIFRSELIAEHCTPGRQPIELLVGVAHGLIRQLFGESWRSRPVWFTHGPPADMATHLRVFGPWVELGQECNGTLLDVRDLEAPLPGSDPAMANHVKQYLEPMLAQAGPTVTEKTRLGSTTYSFRAVLGRTGSRTSRHEPSCLASAAFPRGRNLLIDSQCRARRTGTTLCRGQGRPLDRGRASARVLRVERIFAMVSHRVRRQPDLMAHGQTRAHRGVTSRRWKRHIRSEKSRKTVPKRQINDPTRQAGCISSAHARERPARAVWSLHRRETTRCTRLRE